MANIPNDFLTRKHLRKVVGETNILYPLLEQDCVDSLYVYKDDFDWGWNSSFWGVGGDESTSSFQLNEEDQRLEVTTAGDDNSYAQLWSIPIWSPRKRCAFQAQISTNDISTVKFEFGFISPSLDPATVTGGVLVKSTPTIFAGVPELGVLCFDTDHNTSCDIIQAARGTAATKVQGGNAIASGPLTLLVSMTEGGAVNAWINGVFQGSNQIAPKVVATTFGAPASAETNKYETSSNYRLWCFVQSRSSAAPRTMRVNYVRAWQDRSSSVY